MRINSPYIVDIPYKRILCLDYTMSVGIFDFEICDSFKSCHSVWVVSHLGNATILILKKTSVDLIFAFFPVIEDQMYI